MSASCFALRQLRSNSYLFALPFLGTGKFTSKLTRSSATRQSLVDPVGRNRLIGTTASMTDAPAPPVEQLSSLQVSSAAVHDLEQTASALVFATRLETPNLSMPFNCGDFCGKNLGALDYVSCFATWLMNSAEANVQVSENGAASSLSEAFQQRKSIKSILEAEDSGLSLVGQSVVVAGWVKTGREQGSGAHEPWAFLEVNAGSSFYNLQVNIALLALPYCGLSFSLLPLARVCLYAVHKFIDETLSQPSLQVMVFKSLADHHGGLKRFSATGTSIMVRGVVKEPPQGTQQVPSCPPACCVGLLSVRGLLSV